MIYIQPIGNVKKELLNFLAEKLKTKFWKIAGDVKILKEIDLPFSCFNSLRKQFNSTCILCSLEPRWITLGVIDADLYANRMNFVFGEAELNGHRAVVSLYRLRGNKLYERAVKEATHEIGHVLGLKHCRNMKCVMSFSNSIEFVDLKSEDFCEVCRSKLGI